MTNTFEIPDFTQFDNAYTSSSKLSDNSWITDPRVPDPVNLPKPAGWTMLVRPYPITQTQKSSIIQSVDHINFLNHTSQIGRVVDIGSACWSDPKKYGPVPWAKVGDFISIPKNVGARRKYKGVSFILIVDDEMNEVLPDPQVFNDGGYYTVDIPEEHMEIYNTYKHKDKGPK